MKTFRLFFFKNLLTVLFPTLLPLIILGVLLITVIQTYVKEEINARNMNLLNQVGVNVELIFNELDTLNLNFITNPAIYLTLRDILKGSNYTLYQIGQLNTIKSFLEAPANAKPYIHSIYVYFINEHNRFLSSSTGINNLNQYFDRSWFDHYVQNRDELTVWTEAREVKQYDFEKKPTRLLSIYRKLNLSGSKSGDGVIVLNIDPHFIENSINELTFLPDQQILILDAEQQVMISNNQQTISQESIQAIIANPAPLFILDDNVISKVYSERYGWNFVSITPQASMYETPNRLKLLTLIIILFTFVLSVLLAFLLTRKNYKDIRSIAQIIHSAKSGKPIAPLPPSSKDIYNYIIQGILTTFIEHNYLTMQLSERKYKMQTLELLALQSQINPHFLFNTLETIYWKVVRLTGKPNEANRILESLSDILKYSLDSHLELVDLKSEITYTINYVEIQKTRYREKFHLIMEYDGQSDDVKVFKLMLQPLIENAIYHGIMEKQAPGAIKLKIARRNEHLQIAVIDNGVGIPREKLKAVRELLNESREDFSRHIGLYNTNKRMILTYGEKYALQIKSKAGMGTIVRINIPIRPVNPGQEINRSQE